MSDLEHRTRLHESGKLADGRVRSLESALDEFGGSVRFRRRHLGGGEGQVGPESGQGGGDGVRRLGRMGDGRGEDVLEDEDEDREPGEGGDDVVCDQVALDEGRLSSSWGIW